MANQAATATSSIRQTNGRLDHVSVELFFVKGTIDLASIAQGAAGTDTGTITVTGAGLKLGDIVLGVSAGVDVAGLAITADVTAADVITVRGLNLTAAPVDLASTTFRVLVARALS